MPQSQDQRFRHFRVDSSTDISTSTVQFSLDKVTWVDGLYVAPNNWPPEVAAADAAQPAPTGFVGYWFRLLVGPTGDLSPVVGLNAFYGKPDISPQTPMVEWLVRINN